LRSEAAGPNSQWVSQCTRPFQCPPQRTRRRRMPSEGCKPCRASRYDGMSAQRGLSLIGGRARRRKNGERPMVPGRTISDLIANTWNPNDRKLASYPCTRGLRRCAMTHRMIVPTKTGRDAIKREYGSLFASISAALFEADPIGINFDENTDEYEPEAGTIIPRLGSATSAEDVQVIVHEEFCRWFGPDVGPRERYAAVSAKIWDLWCAFQRP